VHNKFKDTALTPQWWQMQIPCLLALENYSRAVAKSTGFGGVTHFNLEDNIVADVPGEAVFNIADAKSMI